MAQKPYTKSGQAEKQVEAKAAPRAFVGFEQSEVEVTERSPRRMQIHADGKTAVVSRFRGRWYATQDWATPFIGRGAGFDKLRDAMIQAAAFVQRETHHLVTAQIYNPKLIAKF